MQKEIEVKALIDKELFAKIKAQLQDKGCNWSAPIWQHDTVYLPEGFIWTANENLGANPPPALRIRREKNRSILTMKIPQQATLSNFESETEISDPEAVEIMIEKMGYRQNLGIVEKTRIKTKYQNWEICLDEVVDLGYFVEVEEFSAEDNMTVQKRLFDFLERLGVQVEKRITRGYDVLVWAKNNGQNWQKI